MVEPVGVEPSLLTQCPSRSKPALRHPANGDWPHYVTPTAVRLPYEHYHLTAVALCLAVTYGVLIYVSAIVLVS